MKWNAKREVSGFVHISNVEVPVPDNLPEPITEDWSFENMSGMYAKVSKNFTTIELRKAFRLAGHDIAPQELVAVLRPEQKPIGCSLTLGFMFATVFNRVLLFWLPQVPAFPPYTEMLVPPRNVQQVPCMFASKEIM